MVALLSGCAEKEVNDTKLKAPSSLRVSSDNVLTWSVVKGAIAYLPNINGVDCEIVTSNRFFLSDVANDGHLVIKVKAIGDGTTCLDSDWSDELEYDMIVALETPIPVVSGKTVKWDAIDGANKYEYIINGSLVRTDATTIDLSSYPSDKYTISVRALPYDNKQNTVSAWSSEVMLSIVDRLSTPVLTVVQPSLKTPEVVASVSWEPVELASGYEVYIEDDRQDCEGTSLVVQKDPGTYKVKVTAVNPEYDSSETATVTITIKGYGKGTETDPYKIYDATDWRDFVDMVSTNEGISGYLNKYLQLESDIDFENEFIKHNIPYVIYGGVGYYSRKEVKDIIAYLRLLVDSNDDFSFKRIVNVPKRKIGDKVINDLTKISVEKDLSLFDSIDYINNSSLQNFKKIIVSLKEDLEVVTLDYLIDRVLDKTGYLVMLQQADEEDRIDNVMELKSIMKDIMESYEGENVDKLIAFLSDLALKTDVDNINEDEEKVKLMTFHQAKGLEYKVVFMPAMEQGIFPSYRTMGSPSELEEERRVCYVGVTRAKERLYFSTAQMRRMYGQDNPGFPSEFLKSIGKDKLIETGYNSRPISNTQSTIKKPSFETSKKEERSSSAIKIGDKIMHKIFGKGIVVKVEFGKITVAFSAEYGIKTLMADHPSITRI